MTTTSTMSREGLIARMCLTYRHDYGLLDKREQQAIRTTMEQLMQHDIDPYIQYLTPSPVSSELVEKVAALRKFLHRSNQAGPLTSDPSREARVLREVFHALDAIQALASATGPSEDAPLMGYSAKVEAAAQAMFPTVFKGSDGWKRSQARSFALRALRAAEKGGV